MAGPALAITWVLEDSFNELLVGVFSFVREESVHFLGRRYQSQQVQVNSPYQNAPGRFIGMLQAFFRKLFLNEFIDALSRRRRFRRNQRPMRFHTQQAGEKKKERQQDRYAHGSL